jgi:hypothetical protein
MILFIDFRKMKNSLTQKLIKLLSNQYTKRIVEKRSESANKQVALRERKQRVKAKFQSQDRLRKFLNQKELTRAIKLEGRRVSKVTTIPRPHSSFEVQGQLGDEIDDLGLL